MNEYDFIKNYLKEVSDVREDKIQEVKLKMKNNFYEKNKERIIEKIINNAQNKL